MITRIAITFYMLLQALRRVGSRADYFSPAENSARTEHRPMPTTFGDLILLYIDNVNYRVRKISSSFHYCNKISHHHLQVSLRYQQLLVKLADQKGSAKDDATAWRHRVQVMLGCGRNGVVLLLQSDFEFDQYLENQHPAEAVSESLELRLKYMHFMHGTKLLARVGMQQ